LTERWNRRELQRPGMLTARIGHDAASIVAPKNLRYDAGLVVDGDFKPDRSINVAELPGGKYAVTPFDGSAAALPDAWEDF